MPTHNVIQYQMLRTTSINVDEGIFQVKPSDSSCQSCLEDHEVITGDFHNDVAISVLGVQRMSQV